MTTATAARFTRRHLLGLQELSRDEINCILEQAQEYRRTLSQPAPSDGPLSGRLVVNLFFESSTRTRTSFNTAARRLGASVIDFDVAASSISKGESMIDTAETIEAIGADYIVVRHGSSGAPLLISKRVRAAIINAGDGAHEHPTQGLLDALTIRHSIGRVEGVKVAMIGDILHSRVARSNMWCLSKLGASVTLVGPRSLVPEEFTTFGVRVTHDLSAGIADADVIYLLRMQHERQRKNFFPSLKEYRALYGVDEARLREAKPTALVMHPGPVNRGVELSAEVLEGPRSRVLDQVTNGVAVRMAVLTLLEGARRDA